MPLVLLIGPLTGLLHGLVITRLKIDAFIVTLSMMFVYMGLRSGISGGNAYTIPQSFWWLGQSGLGWLPYMVIIVLAILCGVSILYGRTVAGQPMFQVISSMFANPDYEPSHCRESEIATIRNQKCHHKHRARSGLN